MPSAKRFDDDATPGVDRDRASEELRIDDLEGLDQELLRRRWRTTMGRPAPSHLPRSLLVRILFWREQVARVGDVKTASLAMLAAAAGTRPSEVAVAPPPSNVPGLRPGTILVREHAGALHRVMALDHGFAWNGQTYRSLSEVALAITGTRWNGPRFFGLRQSKEPGEHSTGARVRRPPKQGSTTDVANQPREAGAS